MNSINVVGKESARKACKDCGQIYHIPRLSPGTQINCVRCGSCLFRERKDWSSRSVALSLTGVLLFIIANVFPFIGLEASGLKVNSNLISGVLALVQREQWILASMIFLFIFLIPLIELICLSYISFSYAHSRRRPHYRPRRVHTAMRTLMMIHPWSMLEIFLLGVLVTSIKLGDMAALVPGIGSIAFVLLVFVLIALHMQINHDHIWRWWSARNEFSIEHDQSTPVTSKHYVGCHSCHALVSKKVAEKLEKCPRCGDEIHTRIPRSLERSFALLLAAVVLYFPANLLPIMTTTQLGKTQSDTIMSGVIYLVQLGSWPIALVVFIASVAVPIAKIVVIAYLLYSAKYGKNKKNEKDTKMYRITEFIGRWSMVDVFVVCLLVALVQFGLLANIEPSSATLAFASVVVLTMLAAETFDQRLLWDKKQ